MADDKTIIGPEDAPEAAGEAGEARQTHAERLVELEAEYSEVRDRLLRAHAEMENLRRRTAREVTDAKQYAVSTFAREIVGIADNLHRAIETLPGEQRRQVEGPLSALIEGVEVTERELLRVLAKHGVAPIEAQGQKFDPNLHQAMFEIDDASVPAGTILQVLQPGYLIGERVLRPAMVGVSKGGAKGEAKGDPKPNGAPEAGSAAAPATPG